MRRALACRSASCNARRANRAPPRRRWSEDVQRAHGDLEPFARRTEPVRNRHAAAGEAKRGERMRSDDLDAPGNRQPRRVGIDDEGGQTASAGRRTGAGEHHVEIGDAAVGNPGLGPVQHIVLAVAPRAAGDRRHVGPGIGLGQREGGNRIAAPDARQVGRSQRVAAGNRYGPAPQSLHGEGEVGEPAMEGEHLAQNADRAQIDSGRARAARRHGVGQPAGRPHFTHETPAHRIGVGGVRPVAKRVACPPRRVARQRTVRLVEERPAQMGETSCLLRRERALLHASSPNALPESRRARTERLFISNDDSFKKSIGANRNRPLTVRLGLTRTRLTNVPRAGQNER
jgi:hypothetical protein